MESTPRKLSTRTARERKLVLLIRLHHAPSDEARRQTLTANWPTVDQDVVGRFVRQLNRLGMTILSPGSTHISADERLVLNMLAVSQRQAAAAEIIDPALRHIAEDFATRLRECGVWLPLHAPLTEAAAQEKLAIRESSQQASLPSPQKRRVRAGTLRARALEMARQSATVHIGAFLKAGISRQNISRLCADGLLARAGYSRYRSVTSDAG